MIVLFTDFGLEGPYIGQVEAVPHDKAPGIPAVNLFSDHEPFDIQAAACLLPAYAKSFHPGSAFVCVVDPGVDGARRCLVIKADGRWYTGPDEGLFEYVLRPARTVECYELPVSESAPSSFHGRDVFAPAATFITRNGRLPDGCTPVEVYPIGHVTKLKVTKEAS